MRMVSPDLFVIHINKVIHSRTKQARLEWASPPLRRGDVVAYYRSNGDTATDDWRIPWMWSMTGYVTLQATNPGPWAIDHSQVMLDSTWTFGANNRNLKWPGLEEYKSGGYWARTRVWDYARNVQWDAGEQGERQPLIVVVYRKR